MGTQANGLRGCPWGSLVFDQHWITVRRGAGGRDPSYHPGTLGSPDWVLTTCLWDVEAAGRDELLKFIIHLVRQGLHEFILKANFINYKRPSSRFTIPLHLGNCLVVVVVGCP